MTKKRKTEHQPSEKSVTALANRSTKSTSSGLPDVTPFISGVVDKPERFLGGLDASIGKEILRTTKQLFDFAKKTEPKRLSALPELLVDGFDAEQIWGMIQVQNDPLLKHLDRKVKDLVNNIRDVELLTKQMKELTGKDEIEDQSASDSSKENEAVEADDSDLDDIDGLEDGLDEDGIDPNFDTGDFDDEGDEQEQMTGAEGSDKFFNMEDMESFIEQAEREDMLEDLEKRGELDEAGEIEDEDEDDDDEGGANSFKYNDFFDKPGESRPDENDDEEMFKDRPSNLFGEGEEEEEEETLSNFQKKDKKMQETIKELEEKQVSEKFWALKGEVSSKQRPENSLLEVDLDFEQSGKPPPVITEEQTLQLEDIIKKRIFERLFDDVVRKLDPKDKKFKPKVELDTQKSKLSLAELYERDYMKKAGAFDQPDQISLQHKEILDLFKNICFKLDALANFSYTPKNMKEDKDTPKPNVPAIQMEEVLPVGVSDYQTLAPEEVLPNKKKEEKGISETTSEDRKKIRAQKKKHGKLEKDKKSVEDRLREKVDPNFAKKQIQKRAIQTIKESKNVTIAPKKSTDGGGSISSTQLFKQLQEESQTGDRKRKRNPKEDAPKIQSSRLKL